MGLVVAGGSVCVKPMMPTRACAWLLLLASFAACKRRSEPSEGSAPPPPVVSSQPGACGSGGGNVKDSVTMSLYPVDSKGRLQPVGGRQWLLVVEKRG